MTQSMDRLDHIVEDYLGAVSYACRDLPPDQRADLVGDLREHIAAARTVLYQPTEAAIRTILDRLGEPAAIAAEARLAEGLPAAAPPQPRPQPPAQPNRWLSRPLSPGAATILVALTLIAVTIMVIAYTMAMRDPGLPPRP
ncbi:HAAS signaling domain-containing protein [Actinophytocola sp.]|uniref:HAAS signaling domain-containing protein n=1 Tax=Actinophytocola sp. TaxID=1872138 RepID=UPI002D80ED07|nr:hypothetical protein [Actinophytocola sp.]HET9142187.1 hypothetical protein [Actinophytocola sp.]HEU5109934.1 hypothetical protein [Micromonosporaceae bacterium]